MVIRAVQTSLVVDECPLEKPYCAASGTLSCDFFGGVMVLDEAKNCFVLCTVAQEDSEDDDASRNADRASEGMRL